MNSSKCANTILYFNSKMLHFFKFYFIVTGNRLRQMFNLITDVGEEFDQHLKKITNKQNRVDLEVKNCTMQFTTEVIASCAFGIKGNCIENEKSEFLETGNKMTNFTLYRGFELAATFFLPKLAKFCRVRVN